MGDAREFRTPHAPTRTRRGCWRAPAPRVHRRNAQEKHPPGPWARDPRRVPPRPPPTVTAAASPGPTMGRSGGTRRPRAVGRQRPRPVPGPRATARPEMGRPGPRHGRNRRPTGRQHGHGRGCGGVRRAAHGPLRVADPRCGARVLVCGCGCPPGGGRRHAVALWSPAARRPALSGRAVTARCAGLWPRGPKPGPGGLRVGSTRSS
jgi:hypothetical protein